MHQRLGGNADDGAHEASGKAEKSRRAPRGPENAANRDGSAGANNGARASGRPEGLEPSLFIVETAPPSATSYFLLARWLLEQSGELGLEALLVRADSLINDAGAHIASGDVVLMILHREPSEWELEEVAVPWERLSQVAGAIAERGAVLILVAAGAQVAEVAACMARGAHAVVEVYNAVDAIRLVPDLLRGTLTGTGLRAALPCPFAEEPLERLSRLTSIELRVLFDLTKGYQADRIATVEWMSLSTVRAHIRSIFRKLGVNSQLAAVALANGTAALDVSLEGEHEPETVASRA